MTASERLTDESFWISAKPVVFSSHDGHEIDKFIRKFIPPATQNQSVLEIGSFPGPFLSTFGKLGYCLNGIDFHPGNERDLPSWLNSMGYCTGEFYTKDFFEFSTDKKFDVVTSFGFIEHFENFEEVIRMHIDLLKPGGTLLITVPNFSGSIQHWLHRTFDKVNLFHHNTKSMNPALWKNILEKQGHVVEWSGYFGDFWFWKGNEERSKAKKFFLWFIERLIPRIRKILWFQSPSFSAYCGIVAKRPL